jgi:hypothetical protein
MPTADVYEEIVLYRRTILPGGETGVDKISGTNLAAASCAVPLHFLHKHKHHSHLLTTFEHIRNIDLMLGPRQPSPSE